MYIKSDCVYHRVLLTVGNLFGNNMQVVPMIIYSVCIPAPCTYSYCHLIVEPDLSALHGGYLVVAINPIHKQSKTKNKFIQHLSILTYLAKDLIHVNHYFNFYAVCPYACMTHTSEFHQIISSRCICL